MVRHEAGHRSAAISKSLRQSHPRSPRHDREMRSRLAMTVLGLFQQTLEAEHDRFGQGQVTPFDRVGVQDLTQQECALNLILCDEFQFFI